MFLADRASRRTSTALALVVLLAGFLLWLIPLDRYPSFYEDEVFFVLPALRAATGHPFTYAVTSAAPFEQVAWGYHGPLLPRLLELLFHLFGYSVRLSRLPNVAGGWAAVALMVLFLGRRGYRYAGLVLAVLWCGDRATQELLYARMDGLALLWLVVAFLLLRRAVEPGAARVEMAMAACGVFCGLAVMTNPICAVFPVVLGGFLLMARRPRPFVMLCVGGLLSLPLLFSLWGGPIPEAWAQLRWHSARLNADSFWSSFAIMLQVLRWSRYWFAALGLFGLAVVGWLGVRLVKRDLLETPETRDLAVLALFTLAAVPCVLHRSTHPYYWVYFSVWPMAFLAILLERQRRQGVTVLVLVALPWLASAAWTGLRLREAMRYRRQLGGDFLQRLVDEDVPQGQRLLTTPKLYSVPLRAGRPDFEVTSWFAEDVDTCPKCYLLMTEGDYEAALFIPRDDLNRREVLYAGGAFPGAVQMEYPIVLLGPER